MVARIYRWRNERSEFLERRDIMSILIIGGAGYIGSHTVKYFLEQNEDIIVVDNLLTGHKEAIYYNLIKFLSNGCIRSGSEDISLAK